MPSQKQLLPISIVRRARASLRKQGMTGAELAMVEELALLMRDGTMRVLRGSYLAKCLGVSPQRANLLLRRLVEAGLIIRFKTGLIRLNLEKLKEISGRTLKVARRKVSNWLKDLTKSRRRNPPVRNREDININRVFGDEPKPETSSQADREAYWLRKMGL